MLVLFVANPPGRAVSPHRVTVSKKRGMRRNLGMGGFYNPWSEGGRGRTKTARRKKDHSRAGHIGWAYRSDRKKGARSAMRYLAQAGLSRAALRTYRGRHPNARMLLAKRVGRKRKTGRPREAFHTRPFLVNRRRGRVGAYARFVRAFSHRHRWLRGPSLMRAAARAWHGGYRDNADPFPMLDNRRRYRDNRRRYRDNARRRHRDNQIPGLVYFDNRRRYRDNRRRYADNRRRMPGRDRYGRFVARRNPVLPYLAFENRRRRRARRNGILPYAAFNRRRWYRDNRRRYGVAGGALAGFQEGFETLFSTEFWAENVLPLGAGFIGAQFAGGIVQSFIEKLIPATTPTVSTIQKIGSRALGAVIVSGAALLITKRADTASKVLAGGLVAVFAGILQAIFGSETYAKMTGMSDMIGGMAADLTDELKAKIAASVQQQIAAAESGAAPGVQAFVTTQDLQPAPVLGPGPRMQGMNMGSFVSTEELRTAPVAAQGGPAVVADLSDFSDSFADLALV